MDCHEVDVDMTIEDEGTCHVHMQESAFDAPLEADGTADTGMMDPPTDAERSAELVAAEQPEKEPVCHESVAAPSVPHIRRRFAVSFALLAGTLAQGNGVELTEETPVAAQQSAAQESATRRRLVGKQRPPDPYLSKVSCDSEAPSNMWTVLDNTTWEALSERQRYDRVDKRLKCWLWKLRTQIGATELEPPVRSLLRRASVNWRALGGNEKHSVVQLFLQDTQAPKHIGNFAATNWLERVEVVTYAMHFLYARSVFYRGTVSGV